MFGSIRPERGDLVSRRSISEKVDTTDLPSGSKAPQQ